MAAREYSTRLGTISDEQLEAALQRLNLGRFIVAAPIPSGLFGQNVYLTSSEGEFVLRGCPHYDWQFPAERFFTRALHEHTIAPVAWPYLVDEQADIFGWSYVIMPRLPGQSLADPAAKADLNHSDRAAIARAMAVNLAAMHQLTWPHPGKYDLATDSIQQFPTEYSDWVIGNIGRNLQLARRYNRRTSAPDEGWVEKLIEQGRDFLELDFPPTFVMEDYTINNVVMRQDQRGWRVGGVFDFMTAYFGDNEADLCRQLAIYIDEDEYLANLYLQTYLRRHPLRPGFALRFPIHMLNDRLIVWEYFQRPSHQMKGSGSLAAWATRYTDFYRRYFFRQEALT